MFIRSGLIYFCMPIESIKKFKMSINILNIGIFLSQAKILTRQGFLVI